MIIRSAGKAIVRRLSGGRQAVVRRSSGGRQAFVRWSSGGRQAVVRWLSGNHQVVINCAAYWTESLFSLVSIVKASRNFRKMAQNI